MLPDLLIKHTITSYVYMYIHRPVCLCQVPMHHYKPALASNHEKTPVLYVCSHDDLEIHEGWIIAYAWFMWT